MVLVWSIVTTEWQQVVLDLMANLWRNGVDVGISVERHKLLVLPISMLGACLAAFSTIGVWFWSRSQNRFIYGAIRTEGKLFENILQRIDTRQHAHECYHIGLSRATFEQHLADWILIAMESQRMKQNCRLVRFSSWILCTNENKKQDKSWSKNYAKFDQQRNRKKQEENVYYSSRVIN